MSYTNIHLFNAAENSLISPVDAGVAALIFMNLNMLSNRTRSSLETKSDWGFCWSKNYLGYNSRVMYLSL